MPRGEGTGSLLRIAVGLGLSCLMMAGPTPLRSAENSRAEGNVSDAAADVARLSGYPVFRGDSFWYKAIPEHVTLHENTVEFAKEFARQVREHYGHIGINYGDYSAPVYAAGADTPRTRVDLWDCLHTNYRDARLAQDFQQVPIPEFAEPAGGTDAEMTIYDPASDTMWEFWNARKRNGAWEACWGGRMQKVSSNAGIWEKPYGAAATGLPFAPGQILAAELERGEINHVLGIALVDAQAATYSWPANRSDGRNADKSATRIPEGLRLRLDPSVRIDDLHLHPIAKIIARAAQRYGFVVWDIGGSVALRAENPRRYTTRGLPNPYPKLFGGTPSYAIMNGFPWDHMQFLPFDFGKQN
jgi:hypothetical protein